MLLLIPKQAKSERLLAASEFSVSQWRLRFKSPAPLMPISTAPSSSAAQRMFKDLHSTEEDMLEGIPSQESIYDPPSRLDDLSGDAHEGIDEFLELHSQDLRLLLAVFLLPSPLRRQEERQPRLQVSVYSNSATPSESRGNPQQFNRLGEELRPYFEDFLNNVYFKIHHVLSRK